MYLQNFEVKKYFWYFFLCMTCIYKIWIHCNILLKIHVYYIVCFFIHNMHLQNIEANKYFWYFLLYVWHVSTKFGCVAIFWLIFSIHDMNVHVYYIDFCLSIPSIYELLRVRSILDIFLFMKCMVMYTILRSVYPYHASMNYFG